MVIAAGGLYSCRLRYVSGAAQLYLSSSQVNVVVMCSGWAGWKMVQQQQEQHIGTSAYLDYLRKQIKRTDRRGKVRSCAYKCSSVPLGSRGAVRTNIVHITRKT